QTVIWPPPVLAIAAVSANKAEGNGGGTTPFTFTVTRSGDTGGTSSVSWQATPALNPAADAADFAGATSGTLTFSPGETSKAITVNVVADAAFERTESFAVTLSNAGNATIDAPHAVTIATIQDDDHPAAFAQPTYEVANFAIGAGGWANNDQYPRVLADVNGDHMADIVGFGNGGV